MKNVLIVVIILLVLIGGYFVMSSRNDSDTATTTTTIIQNGDNDDDDVLDGSEELPMGVGDTKDAGGLTLTLNSVVSDSRCPVNVTCVQAGEVVVNITVKTATQITQDFSSTDLPLEYDGYAISINEVLPVKQEGDTITSEEYSVTFLIAPLQ